MSNDQDLLSAKKAVGRFLIARDHYRMWSMRSDRKVNRKLMSADGLSRGAICCAKLLRNVEWN